MSCCKAGPGTNVVAGISSDVESPSLSSISDYNNMTYCLPARNRMAWTARNGLARINVGNDDDARWKPRGGMKIINRNIINTRLCSHVVADLLARMVSGHSF